MEAAYDPKVWLSFFTTYAAITAGLLGLLYVSVSLRLTAIVSFPILMARAGKVFATLMGTLCSAILVLIPQQRISSLGWELAAAGLITGLTMLILEQCVATDYLPRNRTARVVRSILTAGSGGPILLTGASLLLGRWGGLYWMCAGLIAALLMALFDAWVLLFELQT